LSLLPFDLGYEVNDLVQKESQDPDREPDEAHHQPSVPVESGGLLLEPVPVDLAVRRQVFQTLVRVQNLSLLIRVLKTHESKMYVVFVMEIT